MNEIDVFILADRALNTIVSQIKDDQWTMVMPANFNRRSQDPLTLRQIIAYHAYDDAWVPDMLLGKTMDEAGKTQFDGDILGFDPKASFHAIVEKACDAARAVTDLDRTVHCSFGDYKVREYFWQINMFRGLRVNDLAVVLGLDPTMPPDLVTGLWEEISPVAEDWRTIGVLGPLVETAPDASPQAKLLALTGRQPT